MRKLVVLTAWFTASAWCQTQTKESDTVQALLAEVHQLRLDIEAMTVASQRVQIALYALQMQDAAVARSTRRLDEAHSRCKGLEDERQHLAAEIQNIDVEQSAPGNDSTRVRWLQGHMAQTKSALDARAADAQTCQGAEGEAASQLRNEQAKMVELQDRVERLDKVLEKLGGAGK